MLFSLDVLVIGPVGCVLGPLAGFGKGISLDVQWCIGQVRYGNVFGSYREESIWRPWTWEWPTIVPAPANTKP